MAPRKKKSQPPPPRFPFVVETFRDPEWAVRSMVSDRPSAINFLSYRRYRITVEEIDEPTEVLVARLQDMWERADGLREAERIGTEAQHLGASLVGLPGSKRGEVDHG
jgi:hypothetical protein